MEKKKVYVAGKLTSLDEREFLDIVALEIEKLGFETFLPHRDVGLAESMEDVEGIFKGDIEDGFKGVDIVVAVLNGVHVGAGTAWELGYAYSKGIPCIGLKTDESVEEGLEYLSAILIHSVDIVESMGELRERLIKYLNEN
jgi:nucleoside 2-deoxyribosyltransferase